ncbi:hypothetical protein [Fictibacillus nanhaiensis]|uniref:hypothetical protein n=1 Tax=Fictibacillus nanhaiensis TaxID=742169 RepID=UPI003C28DFB7
MKQGVLWSILGIFLLSGIALYLHENKDYEIVIPEQSHFSDSKNGLFYREVSFWIEEQNDNTQHFVKADFPGINYKDQYLILHVNDKHPSVWEKHKKLKKSLKLREKTRYSIVTISKDKNILESEEVVLNFNDASYRIETTKQ